MTREWGPSKKMGGSEAAWAKGCQGQAAEPTGASPAASEERVGAGSGVFLLNRMKTGKYPFCLKSHSLSGGMGSWPERQGRGRWSRCPAGQHNPGEQVSSAGRGDRRRCPAQVEPDMETGPDSPPVPLASL